MGSLDSAVMTEPTIEPSSPGEPDRPTIPTEPVTEPGTEPGPVNPGLPTDPGNPATGGLANRGPG